MESSSSSVMDLTASVRSIAPSTEEVITEEDNDGNKVLSHTASLPDLKQSGMSTSVEGEGVVPHTAPQLNAMQPDTDTKGTGEEVKEDDDKVAPTLRETFIRYWITCSSHCYQMHSY
mmetsp:Transcript_9116/g.7591  ORF Transcript_9116/g.7591 Transcript_9116/m.7591 type:complete len:117 (+) Transcript_9116:79-429(+)